MMTRIQTRLTALLTAAMLTTVFSAHAQEEKYVPYPYAFIGIQGGAQTTLTDYNNWKLITPTASVHIGVHFTPAFAARLHVNGVWNKGGIYGFGYDTTYKYKYATSNLDAMINLVNLFSKGDYHPVNLYLIGGVGINYAWNNEVSPLLNRYIPLSNSRNRLSHNFRIGTMLDVNIARNWSVNLEVAANSLSDRYNSKINGNDDWQITAQLGLTYKFGVRHKVKSNRASDIIETPETNTGQTETTPANTNVEIAKPEPTPAPAPVVKEESITRNIFFGLRETKVSSTEQAKLAEAAKWLKEHPEAKVTVTGYADKGTGTAAVNARYAKQRAESVTKELTKKYGIDAKRITTSSKGDTVQPFANNDENRVTIVIAKE